MTDRLKGYYAGFISRLLAFSIDLIIVVVILVFAGWMLNTLSTIFQRDIFESIATRYQIWLTTLIAILFSAGYFIFFWTLIDRTPGKILLGLRIVSRNGRPLTFWQALRRYIGYYISAFALYIGFVWILIDNRRQGWHDKLANTYVIYDWEARQGSILTYQVEEKPSDEPPPNNQPLES